MDEKSDSAGSTKPQYSSPTVATQSPVGSEKKPMSWGKRITWILVIVILVIVLVQYFDAAKYPAQVQVIKEDRIGVNPTGNELDFGDLPRDKSAIRTVNLSSSGNTATYIMIWKFGGISDFISI